MQSYRCYNTVLYISLLKMSHPLFFANNTQRNKYFSSGKVYFCRSSNDKRKTSSHFFCKIKTENDISEKPHYSLKSHFQSSVKQCSPLSSISRRLLFYFCLTHCVQSFLYLQVMCHILTNSGVTCCFAIKQLISRLVYQIVR